MVSLFVNPTQFGPGEDLDAYPRDENRDAELAVREGVDLLWMPDEGDIYPSGFATTVEVANRSPGCSTAPRSGVGPPTSAE